MKLLSVFKRELNGYFVSPVAYVFIIVFLTSSAVATWYIGNFYETDDASLNSFFIFQPWIYLFMIPAVGMRLWSEELRTGTVELLLTLPISIIKLVLGKFLAAWVFMGINLLLTFPMIITVYYLGNPDLGIIFSSYLGSFLMVGTLLSISAFTSALTRNQVISFVLGSVACTAIVLLGWGVFARGMSSVFPVELVDIITSFSVTTYFNEFKNGIIALQGLVYFLSTIIFMLLLNVIVIEGKRR